MRGWNADEDLILKELGIRHIPPAVLADSSRPILDWIETEGITHLAVHFDLDVLDPAHFSPLLFNRPGMPEGAFDGIEQGRMQLDQVVRLLKEIGAAVDMVGLAIAEHLPRSAEHTSELPSLMRITYAAFCLKKNKK